MSAKKFAPESIVFLALVECQGTCEAHQGRSDGPKKGYNKTYAKGWDSVFGSKPVAQA